MENEETEKQNEQKISLPEIILMTLICGGTDVFEIFATLASGTVILAAIFVSLNWMLDIFCWLSLLIWLIMKRIKGVWVLSGNALEMIPGLDVLPLRTITLWLTIFLINRPIKIPGAEKAIQATINVAEKAGKVAK